MKTGGARRLMAETTTTRAIEIQQSGSGSLTIFCRDRLAALEAEDVPALVKSTLRRWTVNDRPFGVTVGPDDDPNYKGELNDLYFFEAPRGAPRWWVEACEAWNDTHGRRRSASVSASGRGLRDVSSSQKGRETASIEALTDTLHGAFGPVIVTAAGPSMADRWKGRLPGPGEPPFGINQSAWADVAGPEEKRHEDTKRS